MPPTGKEALGIHQSDVIIRTALIAGMADMRAKPLLLDYVFASLPRDELTFKDYGEKSLDAAKNWFLNTEVPVSMVPRIDEGKWPRITIALAESNEIENTLGDVHYEPIEYIQDGQWPTLAGPFTPVSYDAITGKVTLPQQVATEIQVAPGMYLIDKVGREHLILGMGANDEAYIKEGTIVDFRDSLLKGVKPMTAVHLRSAAFKETYHIGIHVGSEPVYLTWLHAIVQFVLLRYRPALLEARGFERSAIISSDFRKDETFEGELVFSRFITINGVVRNYWPQEITSTVNSVSYELTLNKVENESSAQSNGAIDLDVDSVGKKR